MATPACYDRIKVEEEGRERQGKRERGRGEEKEEGVVMAEGTSLATDFKRSLYGDRQ